jgi:2-dehydropantoate 2-reductase
MKIAIVGAGAIGGYLGVKLAQSGVDVTFIARGENLKAIQTHGMRLIAEDGTDLVAQNVTATTIAESIANKTVFDYIFLTMKSHQVAPIAMDVKQLCGLNTAIVTMQNGLPWWYFYQLEGAFKGTQLSSVDPDALLWNSLGPERVIGSVVYPAAELISPGVVKLIEGNRFTLGEPSGEKSERVLKLAQLMIAAGFKTPVSNDIRSELWVKLWGNLTFNPVSALTHSTLELICQFPLTRELATSMMQEAQSVGDRIGVHFKISIEKRIAGAEGVGAHKTSMLQDIEQGKAPELEALLGSVVELGRIAAVPTPTLQTVYALMRLLSLSIEKAGSRGLKL